MEDVVVAVAADGCWPNGFLTTCGDDGSCTDGVASEVFVATAACAKGFFAVSCVVGGACADDEDWVTLLNLLRRSPTRTSPSASCEKN